MTGIIRRQVYTAVVEGQPFGALMIRHKADALPMQIHLSAEELEDLRAMIGETLEELRKRQKP